MSHPSPSDFEHSDNRRAFLRNLAWGAGALGAGLSLAADAPTAAAAQPIVRDGRSHFKLSLAAYSFRDHLTGKKKPAMTLEDFIAKCAEYDLDGCELTSYYFPKSIDGDYLNRIKNLTFHLGLDVSGTAIGNNFCLPPGPKRDEQLAHTRKWIDYAATFGAPVIRIFAGGVPEGSNEAEALDRCVEGINESLKYAAQKGVFLALENHGGITSTPDQLLSIVKRVDDSPWFGINFDSGNFATDDPYGDLAKIAPYTINAQIKTEITQGGKKSEADLERIVKILRDAGYRGYVVLEYEAAEDPLIAVPRYLKQLRSLISG